MQKKLSLMLLVTALSNFAPSHGARTKGGTSYRGKSGITRSGKTYSAAPIKKEMPAIATIAESSEQEIPAPVKNDNIFAIPALEVNAPVDNPFVVAPVENNEAALTDVTGTKENPILIEEAIDTAKAAEQSSKVLLLTGLKVFAGKITDKFHSIFG